MNITAIDNTTCVVSHAKAINCATINPSHGWQLLFFDTWHIIMFTQAGDIKKLLYECLLHILLDI